MNPDIHTIELVAQFIEPDPIVYTRLARVNRNFYSVFTSDQLWTPLDAYNLKTGIFKDFRLKSKKHKSILKEMWLHGVKKDKVIKKGRLDYAIRNRYAYMGYLLNGRNKDHKGDDIELMRLVTSIKPDIIKNVPRNILQDPHVIYNSFLHGKEALRYADLSLQTNKDFCYRLVDAMANHWIPDLWNEATYQDVRWFEHNPIGVLEWFDTTIIDKETVEYALRVFPSSILNYGRYSPRSNNQHVREAVNELETNREKLYEIIPGNYSFLRMLNKECWNDKEMCLRALSTPQQHRHTNEYYGPYLRCDDPEIVKQFLVAYPSFEYVPGDCFANKEIVMYALQNICVNSKTATDWGKSTPFPSYIAKSLWNDPEIISIVLDKGYKLTRDTNEEYPFYTGHRLETLAQLKRWEEYVLQRQQRQERETLAEQERRQRYENGEDVSGYDDDDDDDDDMGDGDAEDYSEEEEASECNSYSEDGDNGSRGQQENPRSTLVYAGGTPPVLKFVDGKIVIDKSSTVEKKPKKEPKKEPKKPKKVYKQGDYLAAAYANEEVFECLCDDRDWIMARIENRGDTWNLASERLKKDRELFLYAINQQIFIKKSPKGLVEGTEDSQKLGPCPKEFYNDEEVLRALATLRPIREVPKTDLVKKIIWDTARKNHGMHFYETDSGMDLHSGCERDMMGYEEYSMSELDSDDSLGFWESSEKDGSYYYRCM